MDEKRGPKVSSTAWMRAVAGVIPFTPLALFLTYLLVAVAYTWPLAITVFSKVPHDPIDPLLNTWILWWNTQALPLTAAWWSPPMFFPATGALAFSEHLLGLYPLTTPLQWVGLSPLATYNIAFLLSFPAAAFTAYLLCARLTGQRVASYLAGLYFGFAPYKASQLAHLQMLCVYGLPLVLLSLHAYSVTKRRGWLALFAVSWLLLASSCGYYLVFGSLLIALWLVWFGSSSSSRAAALRLGAVWVLSTLPLVPVLWGYHTIQADYGFIRDKEQIESFSADLVDVLAAPTLSLWSAVLPAPKQERALFPGLSVIVGALVVVTLRTKQREAEGVPSPWSRRLAVAASMPFTLAIIAAVHPMVVDVGLADVSLTRPHKPFGLACVLLLASACLSSPVRRAFRAASVPAFYFMSAAVTSCLSLGPEAHAGGVRFWYQAPYAWFMALPGWSGLRVPTRFWMLTSLCLTVLLAIAVSRLVSRWTAWRLAIYGVASLLIASDIAIRPIPFANPPHAPDLSGEAPAAVVAERPIGTLAGDAAALYRMIQHGRPIVNGYSGHMPAHYRLLEHHDKGGEPGLLAHLRLDRPSVTLKQGRPVTRLPAVPQPDVIEEATLACGNGEGPAAEVLRRLPVRVRDPRTREDVTPALTDGLPDSGWRSGERQEAGRGLEVAIEEDVPICAVLLELGVWPLQYPRALDVVAAGPTGESRLVWSGPTGLLAMYGATRCQRAVPIALRLPSVRASRLSLQLREDDARAPWWVAELGVWTARPGAACPTLRPEPASP